jgi:acyl carrier protein
VTDSILLVHMVIELQEVFGVRFVHEDMQESRLSAIYWLARSKPTE